MPNPTDVLNYVTPQRAIPLPSVDGAVPKVLRGDRYSGSYVSSVVPTKHILAEEGSYFVATTPTPGTKVDYGSAGTQTSFSDTVPFLLIQNTDAAGGKSVFLDFLRILQIGGTAPATTTSVQFAIKTDIVPRTNTAGTMSVVTPAKANALGVPASISRILIPAGAVATIPASSSAAALVARGQLKGGPTLVLDEHTIMFGSVDGPPGGGYLTTVAAYITRVAPVVIPPGGSAVIHLWLPGGATNPFSVELELGLWER